MSTDYDHRQIERQWETRWEAEGLYRYRVDWDRPIAGGPLAHGFDHYFGDDVPNFPPYTFLEDDRAVFRPTAIKPKAMFGHAGPAAPGWDLATVLPTLAQRAGAWLDERNARGDE